MQKSKVGTAGVVVGLLALAAAIFHIWLGPFNPPDRRLSESLSEKAEELKESLKAN